MNTVIFRALAPILVGIMIVFSLFVLLRGHNEPGGGFIGGLVAASAIAIFALAAGVPAVRKAMILDPVAIAGFGVFLAGFSGLLSLSVEAPYLTGLWWEIDLGETEVPISTPAVFDIGVYLTVFGSLAAISLALFDGDME